MRPQASPRASARPTEGSRVTWGGRADTGSRSGLTRRDREVVDFTRSRVKNNTEFTNLMKMLRIEGYNGK